MPPSDFTYGVTLSGLGKGGKTFEFRPDPYFCLFMSPIFLVDFNSLKSFFAYACEYTFDRIHCATVYINLHSLAYSNRHKLWASETITQ